jgi:hypothetical protein
MDGQPNIKTGTDVAQVSMDTPSQADFGLYI